MIYQCALFISLEDDNVHLRLLGEAMRLRRRRNKPIITRPIYLWWWGGGEEKVFPSLRDTRGDLMSFQSIEIVAGRFWFAEGKSCLIYGLNKSFYY